MRIEIAAIVRDVVPRVHRRQKRKLRLRRRDAVEPGEVCSELACKARGIGNERALARDAVAGSHTGQALHDEERPAGDCRIGTQKERTWGEHVRRLHRLEHRKFLCAAQALSHRGGRIRAQHPVREPPVHFDIERPVLLHGAAAHALELQDADFAGTRGVTDERAQPPADRGLVEFHDVALSPSAAFGSKCET